LTQINGKQSGSSQTQAPAADLVSAIKQHRQSEFVSFHTPGHKGYANAGEALTDDLQAQHLTPRRIEFESTPWMFDVTELPGLDDLTEPAGVLATIESRAAKLWGSEHSFLSVNGASACLSAAISACAVRGTKVLIPRNTHRSVINGLIVSGLDPVWYEPNWEADWQYWGAADLADFASQLQIHKQQIACAVAVSPNYAGIFSDIAAMAALCHEHGDIPLIVDEAHGAHLIPGTDMPPSAVTQGAAMVVHSMHKTLSALTQTGLLHRMPGCPVDHSTLRAHLNLQQSSSPSYLLMASTEQALAALDSPAHLGRIEAANRTLRLWLNPAFKTQSFDPAHVLIRLPGMTADDLYRKCCDKGIFPESILGRAVLFLLSPHTTPDHMDYLLSVLSQIAEQLDAAKSGDSPSECSGTNTVELPSSDQLPRLEQAISPRQAFFSRSETVPWQNAEGRIAGECVAPCPPGTPVIIPGQRVTKEILSVCGTKSHLRVVVEVEARSTDQIACKQNPRNKRARTSDSRPTQGEY
jgi:arginine decarboxylase